ncbi:MAG: long-chain-acyl-CoA synthetase [Deltaproteobacteria bacterium]|nr:long-chain-acyl-CoA synthetase [Kofleriaceae bacterium]
MRPLELVRSLPSTARELQDLLGGRAEALARLRLVARKFPSIARGLPLISKSKKDEVLSIGSYLEKNAKERPDAPALYFEERRYTHRELDEQANRWADVLAARGIGKGDAVAVFLENRPEMLFAIAGIVKLGAIAAVINSRQRGKVLEHSFKVSKATTFVVGEELWREFAEVRAAVGADARDKVLWVVDSGKDTVPPDASDAALLVSRARTTSPPQLRDVRLGDPCFYIYTSGTTGMPKASIMSHFRWVKAAGAFGMAALALTPDDVLYLSLPLYHNNALTVAWSSVACSGAALALRRKFSVTAFWDDVRRYRCTGFAYIGELCRYLLNQAPRPDDRDNPVTKIVGNGLRPDIWKEFKQRFGIDEVYEFYAASEGNIAFVNLLNADCTVGICPAPYALVKYDVDRDEPVRDAAGRLIRVGKGEVGLLIGQVNERYVFDGYTDKAASEKKLLRDVFDDGDCWFNSGDLLRDLGFRHAQFVDRVGDTFRWKGENVSTNEVAEVLNTFGQVAESTVYGVQVPGAEGRCGMAAVVLRVPLQELDLRGFAQHVRTQLPPYAVPVFLRFQEELEITGTFKQVKGDLKKQGFDPAAVNEPVYVLPPRHTEYVPLTPDLHRQIAARELEF